MKHFLLVVVALFMAGCSPEYTGPLPTSIPSGLPGVIEMTETVNHEQAAVVSDTSIGDTSIDTAVSPAPVPEAAAPVATAVGTPNWTPPNPAIHTLIDQDSYGRIVLRLPGGITHYVSRELFFNCVSGLQAGAECPGMETDEAIGRLRLSAEWVCDSDPQLCAVAEGK